MKTEIKNIKESIQKRIINFIIFVTVCYIANVYGQGSSIRICPNTPQWYANIEIYTDRLFMYQDYALSPSGCWMLKNANHYSYETGRYIFFINGNYFYYTCLGKNKWSYGSQCIPNPFTGRW